MGINIRKLFSEKVEKRGMATKKAENDVITNSR
jgi:hypothetical protein